MGTRRKRPRRELLNMRSPFQPKWDRALARGSHTWKRASTHIRRDLRLIQVRVSQPGNSYGGHRITGKLPDCLVSRITVHHVELVIGTCPVSALLRTCDERCRQGITTSRFAAPIWSPSES